MYFYNMTLGFLITFTSAVVLKHKAFGCDSKISGKIGIALEFSIHQI